MRTGRVVFAVVCVVIAALSAASARALPPQSVADGFPPGMLSAPGTLTGTTDLSYGALDSGDVNEDGLPDVVSFNLIGLDEGPYSLALFLGLPDGSLAPALLLPVPQPVLQTPLPRIADLDADGHLDLLGLYRGSGLVTALLGHGDGSFDPQVTSGGGLSSSASAFDVGDIDGDGFPDIVLSHGSFVGNTIEWERGRGDGTFDPVKTLATARHPDAILARDLDADGHLDVVYTDALAYESAFVVVLLGLGGGAFAEGVPYPVGLDPTGALAAADANGDDHLDLYKTVPAGPAAVRILLGVGDGTFVPGPVVMFLFLDPPSFEVADLDRDGVPDLIGTQGSKVRLQRMGHTGPIGPPLNVTVPGDLLEDVEIADLDADGLPDVVVSDKIASRLLNTLGPIIDIGYGGTSGSGTPVLTLSGTPAAGNVLSVGVSGLPPLVAGYLVFGAQAEYTPFVGGVLVPSPDVLLGTVTGVGLALGWPAGIPAGTAVYAQAVMTSGGGLAQPLPSNAVVVIAE